MENKKTQVATKKIQIAGKVVDAASDEEMLNALIETDILMAVTDFDGAILTDENGNIIMW